MPFHVPLQFRKALSGRLAFVVASESARLEFSRSGAEDIFHQIETSLVSFTNQATNSRYGSPDSQRLDDYLESLSRRVEHIGRMHQDEPYWERVETLVQAFRSQTAEFSCSRCSPDRVCDGGEADDEIVSLIGLCIAPFRRLFDLATEVARRYYLSYGSIVKDATLPSIGFSTSHTIAKPHDCPVEYFVSGRTNYVDRPGAPASSVVLFICVNRFDRGSFAAIPYVLFHECVCHAFRDIVPSDLERRDPEPNESFAEGWMDWVAVEILKETAQGRGPAAELSSGFGATDSVIAAADNFHRSRGTVEHSARSGRASDYAFGKLCAQKVRDLFSRLLDSSDEAWTRFLGLSLDLNCLRQSATDRNVFLSQIDRYLPGPGQLEMPHQFGVLPPVFRKYLEDNDLRALVEDVLKSARGVTRRAT